MKKKMLFLAILLFVSCFLNAQAMAACPKDRPLLMGKHWTNENCRDFNIRLLSELRFLEDPYSINFPIALPSWHVGCDERDNENLCKKLKAIQELKDKAQQKTAHEKPRPTSEDVMLDVSVIDALLSECRGEEEASCQKLEEIRRKVLELQLEIGGFPRSYINNANTTIEKINEAVKEKNDFFKIKKEIIDKYNAQCKIEYKQNWDPLPEFEGPSWHRSGSNLFQQQLGFVEQGMEYREKIDKHNAVRQTTNLGTLYTNMMLEKENNEAIVEFEKFYTPEKEKQLLKEYEKVVSKRCVGCEYPEPLNVPQRDCQQCANREFVNGECVLKRR